MAYESDNEESQGLLSKLEGTRVSDAVVGNHTIHGRKIPTPSFVAEIVGKEDFHVLIRNIHLFKEPHIISVPVFKWDTLTRSLPIAISPDLNKNSVELITKHHLMGYEPPELYRFSMPQRLLDHALRDDIQRIKKFFTLAMVEDKREDALALLPPFEREFIRRTYDSLVWRKYNAMKRMNSPSLKKIKRIPKKPDDHSDVEGAWSITADQYERHIDEGMQRTIAMRVSSSYVPVVRTLKSSSERFVRKQVQKQNEFTVRLREHILKLYHLPRGRPWLHLSLDQSIFVNSGETQPEDVIDVVNGSLDPSVHCGICVTLTGWDKAWKEGKPRTRLESFFTDLSDITFAHKLPIYGARSKWIGLDLIDRGLTFSGAMLSGGPYLMDSGGGLSSKDPRIFGSVPVYGKCIETDILSLFKTGNQIGKLENPIELHKFDGVDSKCDPLLQSNHKLFRGEFSKPRRIATHTTEVREIRASLDKGILNSGRNYIGKSDLWKDARQ